MNWELIATYLPDFLSATWMTILLTALTMLFSTIIGAPLAVLRDSDGWPRYPVLVFSWITRAIPVLVVLYLVFYGLPSFGITVGAFTCAIIALTIQATGYNLEIIRGALRSVPKQQYDSVKAIGLPPLTSWLKITLPQAVPAMIPPYFSNATKVLKATSITSVITVTEITKKTNDLIGITYATVELLVVSAILYLVLATIMIAIQAGAERVFALPT